jgi:hypothetical protein
MGKELPRSIGVGTKREKRREKRETRNGKAACRRPFTPLLFSLLTLHFLAGTQR